MAISAHKARAALSDFGALPVAAWRNTGQDTPYTCPHCLSTNVWSESERPRMYWLVCVACERQSLTEYVDR